ncbi:hypothetical protein D3C77_657870 [compost metagenome]
MMTIDSENTAVQNWKVPIPLKSNARKSSLYPPKEMLKSRSTEKSTMPSTAPIPVPAIIAIKKFPFTLRKNNGSAMTKARIVVSA